MTDLEKLNISYPIIVEGKYDKLRLESVLNARIYCTDGFGIFNHKEKDILFRTLAKKTKIIVLTDSDGAGKVIRSHLSSALPKDSVIPLYIPQIKGKEKRKKEPSKEGTLGVEGMERQLLRNLFLPFANEEALHDNPLSKTDFYADGFTGEGSQSKRDALCRQIGLPVGMNANAFLQALKILYSYDEYLSLVGRNGTIGTDNG